MPTGHADVWTARVWLLRLAFGHLSAGTNDVAQKALDHVSDQTLIT